MRQHVIRNPRPRIGNPQAHAVVGPGAQQNPARPLRGILRHRLGGVGEQVDHHLLQGVAIAQYRRDRRQVLVDRNVLELEVVAHEHEGALDHVIHVHRDALGGALARKGEQVPHDAPCPVRLLVDDAEVPAILAAQLLLLEQKLGEAGDRGEGIVELVGYARDELSHGRELLALDQLGLHSVLVGHVFHQHDDTLVLRGCGDTGGVHADRAPERTRSEDQGLRPVAPSRRREQLEQGGRPLEERVGQVAPDHRGDRDAQEGGQRAVRPAYLAGVVHHGDAPGERVERRLPLLFRVAHHLEEARIGDHDGGMRRDRREQADVLRRERAISRVGNDERPDHHAVRAQRHGGRRFGHDPLRQGRGLAARAADQLEPLATERSRHEARIVGADGASGEGSEGALGRGHRQGTRLRPAVAIRREGDQRPLGVEESHGVAHHLLHDAIELERPGQDVGQLLEGKELG